jgi:hypothetical protein
MMLVDVCFKDAVVFSRASQTVAVSTSQAFENRQKGKRLCAMLRNGQFRKRCVQ